MPVPVRVVLPIALAAALLLAACGDDDLAEASAELAEAREQVEEARAWVEERQDEARAADQALSEAKQKLAEREQQLAKAKRQVAKQANDAVLFHSVQRRLLDADELAGVAISARVEQRVVTLEGAVSRPDQKQRAERIARETAGVETVVNRIQLQVGAQE